MTFPDKKATNMTAYPELILVPSGRFTFGPGDVHPATPVKVEIQPWHTCVVESFAYHATIEAAYSCYAYLKQNLHSGLSLPSFASVGDHSVEALLIGKKVGICPPAWGDLAYRYALLAAAGGESAQGEIADLLLQ